MASHTQVNLSRHFAGLDNMMLAGLLIESTASFVVIIASFRGWAIDSSWYESSFSTCLATQPAFQLLAKFLCLQGLQISKRAAAETALCLVANILGYFNALAIIFFSQHDTLKKLFVNMLPLEQGHGHVKHPHTTPAPKDKRRCLQLGITVFPCFAILATAMWAGAVTPMKSTVAIQSTVDIPHFGSSITTTEIAVSGSVGTALLSKLLSITASSVLFSNGSISRQTTSHNAGFFYRGRSYGVGSFVGIRDQIITENPSTSAYHFRQSGYLPHIMCQYNRSMDFHIDREYPHRTFAVTGFLPDSVGSAQWSEYIGESPRSIVAMGVADGPKSTRRFISIAAGEDYKALNATQCTVDFVATLFNVSVDLKDRSIVVVPSKSIEDFDPRRDLTRAIVRQFDSISNSLQSFHGSVLGDVILSHIAAWKSSLAEPAPEAIATLLGLQSFFITMTDAMLVAYGSTQLEMSRNSRPVVAEVEIEVFTFGNKAYLVAVAALNATALWLHWKLRKGARGGS